MCLNQARWQRKLLGKSLMQEIVLTNFHQNCQYLLLYIQQINLWTEDHEKQWPSHRFDW
jgi:hypothetical protein